jgi:hypothetical protein
MRSGGAPVSVNSASDMPPQVGGLAGNSETQPLDRWDLPHDRGKPREALLVVGQNRGIAEEQVVYHFENHPVTPAIGR